MVILRPALPKCTICGAARQVTPPEIESQPTIRRGESTARMSIWKRVNRLFRFQSGWSSRKRILFNSTITVGLGLCIRLSDFRDTFSMTATWLMDIWLFLILPTVLLKTAAARFPYWSLDDIFFSNGSGWGFRQEAAAALLSWFWQFAIMMAIIEFSMPK